MSQRDLSAEIRAARVQAPQALRERVSELPNLVPARNQVRGFGLARRVLLLGAPAAALAAAAVTVVLVTRQDTRPHPTAAVAPATLDARAKSAGAEALASPVVPKALLAIAASVGGKLGPVGRAPGGSTTVAVRVPRARAGEAARRLRSLGTVTTAPRGSIVLITVTLRPR